MKKIKRWQWGVLLTSFFQLISPGILTALGLSVSAQDSSSSPESSLQLTPAGYTFIIWGVITILSFAYGVYQAIPRRANMHLHKRLSKGLTIVYLLFVIWLVAAIMQWLVATVLIFIAMFLVLTLLFEKLIEERKYLTLTERIILFGQIAIYTGWTTVAIFVNIASAIKFYGLSDEGIIGITWQSAILILALVNSKYWLKKFNQNLVFAATIIWALTGVFLGLSQYTGNEVLRLLTIAGIILVLGHLIMRHIPNFIPGKKQRGS